MIGVGEGYYPFRSLLPGRSYSSDSYRFAFNGMEKDDEVHGSTGTSYTTEFRMLDPRIGRWLSTDPIVKVWESPYAGFGNNPIFWKDPSGLDPENGPGGDEKPGFESGRGTTENPIELREFEVCGNCDGSTAAGAVGDVAKGVEANKGLNRYQLNPNKGSTVLGVDDSRARTKANGRVVRDWVWRVDEPHKGAKYPHTNVNTLVPGISVDPHTPISNTAFQAAKTTGKVLTVAGKVARPIAVVTYAARIIYAVHQEQGNIMGKKVVVTASDVAGGWVGAAAGAAIGAKGGAVAGAVAGAAIGVWFWGVGAVPGAAIGGFVGGLGGSIAGAFGGSWLGGNAAKTFYDE